MIKKDKCTREILRKQILDVRVHVENMDNIFKKTIKKWTTQPIKKIWWSKKIDHQKGLMPTDVCFYFTSTKLKTS